MAEDKNPGAGAGTQGQSDLPDWLTKLPDDVRGRITGDSALLDDVKKGWLRERDYTQKTQELAEKRKKWGDRDPEAEIAELEQWRGWRQNQWQGIEQKLQRLDELERQGQQRPREVLPSDAEYPTPEDFIEQDRLRRTVDGLYGKTMERVQKWHEQEIAPRYQKMADGYVNTLVGLQRILWEAAKTGDPEKLRQLPDMMEVLREAQATQDGDWVRVANNISQRKGSFKKEGFDEGYERGKKEALDAARAQQSPPPPGTSMPAWRPPQGSRSKQSRDERFMDVYNDVSKKHGGNLPV
jgi:hypothetical protein